jgi:surface antigen
MSGGVLALGLGGAACSTSYQLGALTGGSEARRAQASAGQVETTGSVSVLPPESDLVFAKAAASEVLGRGGKDASTSWENPQSGARGTVTPIATAYAHPQDGRLCRDFLASYVKAGTESWLQGEACQSRQGRTWEVRVLKPWKRL